MSERSRRNNIQPINLRARRTAPETGGELAATLAARIVGQSDAIEALVPCIEMFQAGLAPESRPAGVFLLLGPTGTGKTRTVEALAEALHGSHRNVLKIDCGEFQMEHEVAKLIGAPPGYLGHRETQPLLSQQKLTSVTTDGCGLAVVLFDEIEKAAPSLTRLLLGVLDRGILRLGDNTSVNFEKTIVFLTSNLGAKEMMRELNPGFGFERAAAEAQDDDTRREETGRKLKAITLGAVKRKFSPEFVNRIDHVITYQPLDAESFAAITEHEINNLQRHINERLGMRRFTLDVPWQTRKWLIEKGTSPEYGARELKRTIHRHLTQPLAARVARQQIPPATKVRVDVRPDGEGLSLRRAGVADAGASARPTLLVVDPNPGLLDFLDHAMTDAGWDIVAADSSAAARKLAAKKKPHAALIDAGLEDDAAIPLAVSLVESDPRVHITLMSKTMPPDDVLNECRDRGFDAIRKPFPVPELLALIRTRLLKAA